MLRLFRKFLITLMSVPAVLTVFSFAGVVHPAGDSLAVFRPILTVATIVPAVLLLMIGGRYRAASGIGISVIAFFSMMPSTAPSGEDGQAVTVYQKNLLLLTRDTRRLREDILASGADIVTLQELDPRNIGILNDLRDAYPYQHLCPYWGFASLAVLSRWPATGQVLPCDDRDGLAAMMVDTGRHRIWVGAVHLGWPWPYRQSRDAARIAERLAPLNAPLVLGGDFNMVAWSYTLGELTRAGGLVPAGRAGATFTLPDIPVRVGIDHVFMPSGASDPEAAVRPRFGSDHHGVVAKFTLP